ncbi:hypothetical protein SNE40_006382 [Patella caerulea]|uniref:Uncharacterized protein n=1 Tax=Patella caerulea TaxID=87958 RepID=A0AAN8Q633_PATCE
MKASKIIPFENYMPVQVNKHGNNYGLPVQKLKEADMPYLSGIPPVPDYSSSDIISPVEEKIVKHFLQYKPMKYQEKVLILTPIHNVANLLIRFGNLLKSLTYPHNLISIAFGEDCSVDSTLSVAKSIALDLEKSFRSVKVFHFNLTGQIKGEWNNIHNQFLQLPRRKHLAKSRNLLLKSGLRDEDWVLWIDSDISFLPPDIIQHLLSSDKDIVVPSCVYQDNNNKRVYDKNTWRETELSMKKQKELEENELMLEGYDRTKRLYLPDLRAEGRVVPIDGVGGCTLLINADLHRKGLNFPETVVDHHIETEGLAKMAKRMGFGVYGMPFVEVFH